MAKKCKYLMPLLILIFSYVLFPKCVQALEISNAQKDFNCDGIVDILDLNELSARYNAKKGNVNYDSKYDLNNDGIIDIYDMTIVSKSLETLVDSNVYINNIINKYFENKVSAIKLKSTQNYSNLILNNEFKNYVNMDDSYNIKWYNGTNHNLTNNNLNVAINNLQISSTDTAIAKVTVSMSSEYNNLKKYEEQVDYHILKLKLYKARWYIEKDINEENMDFDDLYIEVLNDNYTSEKQKILSDAFNNLQQSIDDANKNKIVASNRATTAKGYFNKTGDNVRSKFDNDEQFFGYDRIAAFVYAHTYYEKPNSNYTSYKSDCQNFVSQCLRAGKLNPKYEAGSEWYPGSTTWINVEYFADFALNNCSDPTAPMTNGFIELGRNELYKLPSNVNIGDVLQFHTRFKGYTHSVLINRIDEDGNIHYAGHTSPRWDKNLNETLTSSLKSKLQYDKIRIIHISNKDNFDYE